MQGMAGSKDRAVMVEEMEVMGVVEGVAVEGGEEGEVMEEDMEG